MIKTYVLQLPQVKGKHIFSQFSDKDNIKHLLGLQSCHLFQGISSLKFVHNLRHIYALNFNNGPFYFAIFPLRKNYKYSETSYKEKEKHKYSYRSL